MPIGRRAKFFAMPALASTALFFGACERAPVESLGRADAPIIGGKLDTTHKAVVSLLKHVTGGYAPICSGTLIAPNLVLTAHHCVAALNSPDGSVECGKTEFGALERASSLVVSVEANVGQEGLAPFRVSEVWVPPGDASVCGRDIALLLLSGDGVPVNEVAPIEPALTDDLATNEVFQAVGYGLQQVSDETGKTAGHRMVVSNARVDCDGAACGTEMVKDGEFVADSPVCSGDSGGPALDESGRVVGITSRGDEACTLGIYTSVSAWRDFIVEKALQAAAEGRYAPPGWASPNQSTVDAGTTTAPDAASPAAGGGSSESPVVDPLGQSCTGACPNGYACWTTTGKPPGVCVPECGATSDACPSGYGCDASLGVCTKSPVVLARPTSCAMRGAPSSPSSTSALWLGVALFGWSIRRRARSNRPT